MRGFTSRQPRVVECRVSCARVKPRSGFISTHGARLIDSTPPATQIEASPTAIARFASTAASMPEPQRRLTVAAGTLVGSSASSTAMRATLRFSSPAPFVLPK